MPVRIGKLVVTVEIVVCERTGLALVPAREQQTFRLAKPSYGALNPPPRGLSSSEDRAGWNRFDLPGAQTIYAASSTEGAYGELLGALKISGTYRGHDYLDEVGDVDLYALIAEDWADLGKRGPGVVDIGWLYAHRMYTVTMPASGRFVEIEHARTLTYLSGHIPLPLWERGTTEITASEIRSSDRHLTTELASTLATAVLAEHSLALGAHYHSKHGTEWTCWAVWLRDGVANALSADSGTAVALPPDNAALVAVLDTYNLVAG